MSENYPNTSILPALIKLRWEEAGGEYQNGWVSGSDADVTIDI